VEKSTARQPGLRSAHLSLCVLLTALSLSAPVFVPHGLLAGAAKTNPIHSNHPEDFAHDTHLSFPKPFQAVNDSGGADPPVQVGAWGDQASVGNSGVQVEIQTNSYNVSGGQDDAFWVGDVLGDGSFVQFGYLIMPPGYYCLSAQVTASGTVCSGTSDNVGFSDARWFWAYFPNAQVVNDWYYGFGTANSVGSNGTWHLYSIQPGPSGDWSFGLDGVTIYSSNFPSTSSTSPVHLVAEKASGPYLSQLGPVEFRGLAYLGNDTQWHATSSLNPIDGCGAADNDPCTVSTAYGVESVGPNEVLAGSSVSAPDPGQLVWERQSSCTLGATLQTSGTAGAAPLNVTFTDSVSAPQGIVRTDWWFGDGSHLSGNTNQTVTYSSPGNYTPVVRVLDSIGCLSEESGEVSVAASNGTSLAVATAGTSSFGVGVIELCVFTPRDAYAPCD
jgi:PKD repeat protein